MHTKKSRFVRRTVLTVLSAGIAVALAGCVGASGPSEAGGTDGEPVAGATMRFRLSTDTGCIDPHQVRLRAVLGMDRQVVDSLTFQDADGQLEPWLASSWEVSPDGTQFTFHLRDDVTFSDGSMFDALAAKANFDGIVAMGTTASIAFPYLNGLVETAAPDPETFVVTFGTANAQFLQATSTPSLGMLAPATLAADLGDRCSGSLIGSGPFTIQAFRANDAIELVRREGYAWSPASFENQGDSYLDGITYSIVSDATVAAGMLQSDQLDAIWDVGNVDTNRLLDAGYVVTDRPNPGVPMSLYLNSDAGPLQDVAVRRALLIGMDRQTAINTTLPRTTAASTGVLSPTTPGYVDQSEQAAYDPDAAMQGLKDAGWVVGSDGIRERNGERLTVELNLMTPTTYIPFLELVQAQYRELGIDLVINQVSPAEDEEARGAGSDQVRFNANSRADAAILASTLRGHDATLDGLLDQQATELNLDARNAIVEQAVTYALDNAYVVPIHDLVLSMAYSSDVVHGVVTDATNTPSLVSTWITRQ